LDDESGVGRVKLRINAQLLMVFALGSIALSACGAGAAPVEGSWANDSTHAAVELHADGTADLVNVPLGYEAVDPLECDADSIQRYTGPAEWSYVVSGEVIYVTIEDAAGRIVENIQLWPAGVVNNWSVLMALPCGPEARYQESFKVR
jgi:hypothetical protein